MAHEHELLDPIGAFDEIEQGDEPRPPVRLDTTEKRVARLLLVHEVFDTARKMLEANSIVVK